MVMCEMANDIEKKEINMEDALELDIDKLVKARLKHSLPRIFWAPIFYGVYVPLAVVVGVLWIAFWKGMPWTGFGGIAAVAYLFFGVTGVYIVAGCVVALVVIAAGVYGNLEPTRADQVRDYATRGEKYVKWYMYHSLL